MRSPYSNINWFAMYISTIMAADTWHKPSSPSTQIVGMAVLAAMFYLISAPSVHPRPVHTARAAVVADVLTDCDTRRVRNSGRADDCTLHHSHSGDTVIAQHIVPVDLTSLPARAFGDWVPGTH